MTLRKVELKINDCLQCPHVRCDDFLKEEPQWVCTLKNNTAIRKDTLGYMPIPDFCPLEKVDEDHKQQQVNTSKEPLQSELDPL